EITGVDAVAAGQVVGIRIARINDLEQGGTLADTGWIHRLDLCRSEEADAVWRGVLTAGPGATSIVIDVADIALLVGRQGHGARDCCVLCDAVVNEVEEEKQLVVFDGAANAAAELVLHQLGRANVRQIVEPVIGCGRVIAVILARVAVPVVGSAPGDQLELAAAALSAGGRKSSNGAAELLH